MTRTLLTTLFALIAATIISSCKKDRETTTDHGNTLIGAWSEVYTYANGGGQRLTYSFRRNGTFVAYLTVTSPGNGLMAGYRSYTTGRYKLDGAILQLYDATMYSLPADSNDPSAPLDKLVPGPVTYSPFVISFENNNTVLNMTPQCGPTQSCAVFRLKREVIIGF